MDSRYNHQLYEDQISQKWQDHGVFTPSKTVNGAKKFTLVLPPPNANDPLHVGHAMYTLEDILVRFHRMRGDDTLWIPGADHAGIETQFVFEKKLQKKGQSRFQSLPDDLGLCAGECRRRTSSVAKIGFFP